MATEEDEYGKCPKCGCRELVSGYGMAFGRGIGAYLACNECDWFEKDLDQELYTEQEMAMSEPGPICRFATKETAMDRMMQFFAYDHLPEHLKAVSKPFGELAQKVVDELPSNPERTVALRKLLEAKDCAVRALLYKAD